MMSSLYVAALVVFFFIFVVLNGIPADCVHGQQIGGAGKAIRFDHRENHILSVNWQTQANRDITAEFWFKLVDIYVPQPTVIGISEYDVTQDPTYDNPDAFQIRFSDNGTCAYRAVCVECDDEACKVLQQSEWTHFAVSWNTTDGALALYKNGELAESLPDAVEESSSLKNMLTSDACFTVGHEPDEFCGRFDEMQAFDGILDEFRIWGAVRTPDEIAEYFDKVIPSSEAENHPDLNVYYTFDDIDTENNIVPDHSGNDNFGMLGRLPTLRQAMLYTTARGEVPPASPRIVYAVDSPVKGHFEPIDVFTNGKDNVTITIPFVFEDDTVLVKSEPGKGELHSQNGIVLGASDPIPDRVDGTSEFAVVVYVPDESEWDSGADEDTFTVELDSGGGSDSVNIVVRRASAADPVDLSVDMLEDELQLIKIGEIGDDGSLLEVVIEDLPQRGQLYQVAFEDEFAPVYGEILRNTSALTPISQPGTLVTSSIGVILFQNELGEFGDNYANFTIRYRDSNFPEIESANTALISLNVLPREDPPKPVATSLTFEAGEQDPVVVELKATETVAQQLFYRIVDFPKFGKLVQLNDDDEILMDWEMNPEEVQPTVVSWVSDILDYSTQYSRDDGTQDYHATQVLGEPDFFPSSGDSPLAWSFNSPDADDIDGENEFLVSGFTHNLYLEKVDIYETNVPGAVVRIAITAKWEGTKEATQWQTVWSSEDVENAPATSRIFSPPICPFRYATEAVLIEMDSEARDGWNEYDAVQALGTLNIRNDAVRNLQGKIAYIPEPGVYQDPAQNEPVDSFTFVADDCSLESNEPARVRVFSSAPEFPSKPTSDGTEPTTRGSWKTINKLGVLPDLPNDADATVIDVDLDEVANDLVQRGLESQASQVEQVATIQVVRVVTGSEVFGEEPSASTGTGATAPLDSSAIVPQLFQVDENGKPNLDQPISEIPTTLNHPQYAINPKSNDGDVNVTLWISVEGILFELNHQLGLECGADSFRLQGSGICVPCGSVPSDQRDGSELFLEKCVRDFDRNRPEFNVMIGLAGIGIVASIAIGGYVWNKRNTRVIHLASPVFLYLVLVGVVLAYVTVFTLYMAPSVPVCSTTRWTLNLGLVLSFVPLFAKTHRLVALFNNRKLKKISITNSDLMFFCGQVLLAFLIYLTVWTAVDPPVVSMRQQGRFLVAACSSDIQVLEQIPIILHAILLLYGISLAVRARTVPNIFNESTWIAASIYTIFIVVVLTYPIAAFLTGDPVAQFVISSAAIIISATSVLGFLFVPKLWAIYNGSDVGPLTTWKSSDDPERIKSQSRDHHLSSRVSAKGSPPGSPQKGRHAAEAQTMQTDSTAAPRAASERINRQKSGGAASSSSNGRGRNKRDDSFGYTMEPKPSPVTFVDSFMKVEGDDDKEKTKGAADSNDKEKSGDTSGDMSGDTSGEKNGQVSSDTSLT